jgi:hypothetical protein
MNCDTALDRMLEAGPAELRGDAGSPLGRHLAACPRCRPVAEALAAALGSVDDTVTAYARTGDADAAVDAALAASRDTGPGPVGPGDRAGRPDRASGRLSGRLLRSPRAWVPLAAAAVVAAVLLVDGPGPGPPVDPGPVARDPALDPRVAVVPPPDRNAAVLETRNPNITIVWLYEREGS